MQQRGPVGRRRPRSGALPGCRPPAGELQLTYESPGHLLANLLVHLIVNLLVHLIIIISTSGQCQPHFLVLLSPVGELQLLALQKPYLLHKFTFDLLSNISLR